jgi:GDP-L-fucose synthase
MAFWEKARVMVTGGDGFLGKVVVEKLRARGCREIFVPTVEAYNLVDMDAVVRAYEAGAPDIVLHLAGKVGSIEENRLQPGEYYYSNLMMGTQLMEVGRQRGVKKFVICGTMSSYPKDASIPLKEEDFWSGYPDEVAAPYAMAKKVLAVQAAAYRSQYGFKAVMPLLANIYGPGDYAAASRAHVIASTIRKCLEASDSRREEIVAWGSGETTREFLFVEDAAEGLLRVAEHYDAPEPVNIGTGQEVRIRDLVGMIARIAGYSGHVVWDETKPAGAMRRCADVSKAWHCCGFRAGVSLEEGLTRTVSWFRGLPR